MLQLQHDGDSIRLIQTQHFPDQLVHLQMRQPQCRAARIIGKIVHHIFHRGNLADDSLRGTPQQLRTALVPACRPVCVAGVLRKVVSASADS